MVTRPLFSEETRDEFEKEYEDPETALRIASTEMDGANETNRGTVSATQTYCNILQYNEDLEESKGAQEGKKKCEEDVDEFLKNEGYTSVDDWIRKNSK